MIHFDCFQNKKYNLNQVIALTPSFINQVQLKYVNWLQLHAMHNTYSIN